MSDENARNYTTDIPVTREMLKAGERAYEAAIRARLEYDDVQEIREQAMTAAYRAMRRVDYANAK